MKRIIIISLLLCVSALARVGETPEQCVSRYGAALTADEKGEMALFQKGGMDITVFYRDGKVECISYTKSERDILDKPVKMSATEIDALLGANAGEAKWSKTKFSPTGTDWTNDDAALVASYRSLNRLLMIMTKDCMNRQIAESKEKEKKQLEGL